MKFTTPDRLNVEFSGEEINAIEITLSIMETLLEKMKNTKYTYFSTDDRALVRSDIEETRNILNFLFQGNGNDFYLE